MKINALKEKRSGLVSDMKAIISKAETETRNMTAEEKTKFDTMAADVENLDDEIKRHNALADAERRSVAAPVDGGSDSLETLSRKVSVLKVLRSKMEGRELTGAEAEYAQEAERRSGRKAEGVYIPMAALETRTGINDTTTGAALVGTDHKADQYIGALRDKLIARQLGVRVLSGLRGDVTVPKYDSGLTTGWVTEGQAVPAGEMGFDSVTLTPKHVGGKTEMSRQLIMQSSPDIERLVRDDLAHLIAKQIDAAIFAGTGLTGQPTGILNTTGIQTDSLLDATHLDIMQMIEKLEVANLTGAHWITTPAVKTLLATRLKDAGISGYLLENGMMGEIPFHVTNQMPAGNVLLGDFSQVMLGVWSEIDLLVNPYAEPAYSRGGVQVRAMATCDIAVRHPEGFVLANDFS